VSWAPPKGSAHNKRTPATSSEFRMSEVAHVVPEPITFHMTKSSGSTPGAPGRILVVDDDPNDVQALRLLLEGEGLFVEAASSAEEALARFREGTYMVVLADLQLPGESGLGLVRTLRDTAPATGVVVMTGHASVSTAVAALKYGAIDYLKKPVNP